MAGLAALIVAAGFGLAIHQSKAFRAGSSRIDHGHSDARAAALLRSAQTLNPDTRVRIEQARLAMNQGRPADAKRLLLGVVRDEPENAYAWGATQVLLLKSDPALARKAAERFRQLVPQVPAP